jgi:hypothetical protein
VFDVIAVQQVCVCGIGAMTVTVLAASKEVRDAMAGGLCWTLRRRKLRLKPFPH